MNESFTYRFQVWSPKLRRYWLSPYPGYATFAEAVTACAEMQQKIFKAYPHQMRYDASIIPERPIIVADEK